MCDILPIADFDHYINCLLNYKELNNVKGRISLKKGMNDTAGLFLGNSIVGFLKIQKTAKKINIQYITDLCN